MVLQIFVVIWLTATPVLAVLMLCLVADVASARAAGRQLLRRVVRLERRVADRNTHVIAAELLPSAGVSYGIQVERSPIMPQTQVLPTHVLVHQHQAGASVHLFHFEGEHHPSARLVAAALAIDYEPENGEVVEVAALDEMLDVPVVTATYHTRAGDAVPAT